MTDPRDPLDDWLTTDAGATDLVPSSGFTERVMKAVRESTEAPAPIPFPWLRALPWLAAAVALVAFALARILALPPGSVPQFDLPAGWQADLQSEAPDAVWTMVAVLVSLVTTTFAVRTSVWRRRM